MSAQILTFQDLNTTVNHEPRIEDLLIAKKLGFARPRKIRELIDANKTELESYGSLAPTEGELRGQKFTTYWLNEAQTILICILSRTEKAAEVRKQVIDVFMAYRKGAISTELNLDDLITPHEQRMLQEAIKLKHEQLGLSYPSIYERIKNKFRVAKYNQVTRAQFADVLFYVCNLGDKQKALPAPASDKIDVKAVTMMLESCIMAVHQIKINFNDINGALSSHTHNVIGNLEGVTKMLGSPRRLLPAQVVPDDIYQIVKTKPVQTNRMLAIA